MPAVKAINLNGGAVTPEEQTAADHAFAAFRSRKTGIFPFSYRGIQVRYEASKGIAHVSGALTYFYSGLVEQDLDDTGQLMSTAQVLAYLDAGELPPGFLRAAVKRFHPISSKISVPSIPVLEYEDSVLEGSIEDLDTLPGFGQAMPTESLTTVKIQRVATISYLGPDGHTKSETYTGSYQYTATRHSDGETPQSIWTVNKIFTGQYVDLQASDGRFTTNVTGINPGERAFLVDGYTARTQELASYIEGDAIQIGLAETGNYVFPLETTQDAAGRPIIPPLKFPIPEVNGMGSEEGTPYPYGIKTLPILEQYREDYKPKYDLESPNPAWQDSSMTDGEMVTIYPVQYRSDSLGDLGLYPSEEEREQATGIFLTQGYKFQYRYTDGALTFVATVPVKDKQTGEVVERKDLPMLLAVEASIEDVLALAGLSTVEELYAAVGVSSEAELLALLGLSTMQEWINLVISPETPKINFVFKSSRSMTGWKDIDELYSYQRSSISGSFDGQFLLLNGLYDFLQ